MKKNNNKNFNNNNNKNFNILNNNQQSLNSIGSIYSKVYMHYGPICIKKNAIFFHNIVSIKNKVYSMEDTIFNDNLYEITINQRINLRINQTIILRIQFKNNYELIKNQPRTFPIVISNKYTADL